MSCIGRGAKMNFTLFKLVLFCFIGLVLSGCYVSKTSILNSQNSDEAPFVPLRCGTVNDLSDNDPGQILRIIRSSESLGDKGHLYEVINDEAQAQQPIPIRFKLLDQGRYLVESPMYHLGEKMDAYIYLILEEKDYGLDIVSISGQAHLAIGAKNMVKLGKSPGRWVVEGKAESLLSFFSDLTSISAKRLGICKRLE